MATSAHITTSSTVEYGVFQEIRGEWVLIYVYQNRSAAEAELSYLRDTLGAKAAVFVRKARASFKHAA